MDKLFQKLSNNRNARDIRNYTFNDDGSAKYQSDEILVEFVIYTENKTSKFMFVLYIDSVKTDEAYNLGFVGYYDPLKDDTLKDKYRRVLDYISANY